MTKKQLEEQLDDVGDTVAELLNPQLSREEIVGKLVELNDTLNPEDDEDIEDEDLDDFEDDDDE